MNLSDHTLILLIAGVCFVCSMVAYSVGFRLAKAASKEALEARREEWLESLDEGDTEASDMVINLTRPT